MTTILKLFDSNANSHNVRLQVRKSTQEVLLRQNLISISILFPTKLIRVVLNFVAYMLLEATKPQVNLLSDFLRENFRVRG